MCIGMRISPEEFQGTVWIWMIVIFTVPLSIVPWHSESINQVFSEPSSHSSFLMVSINLTSQFPVTSVTLFNNEIIKILKPTENESFSEFYLS